MAYIVGTFLDALQELLKRREERWINRLLEVIQVLIWDV